MHTLYTPITANFSAMLMDLFKFLNLNASTPLNTNDPATFMRALNTLARARGMTQIAKDAGVNRESLYKLLSGAATFLKIWASPLIKLLPCWRAKPC